STAGLTSPPSTRTPTCRTSSRGDPRPQPAGRRTAPLLHRGRRTRHDAGPRPRSGELPMCLKPFVIVTNDDDPLPHIFYRQSVTAVAMDAAEYFDHWSDITSLTIRETDDAALRKFLLQHPGIAEPKKKTRLRATG